MALVSYDPINEIENVKKECLELLDNVLKVASDNNSKEQELYRLMSTPLIYSLWERTFTISTITVLKVLREETSPASEYSANIRALWLQKESFCQSFISKTLENSEKVNSKKGTYKNLLDFLVKLDAWHALPLENKSDYGDLVMTFSNVNSKVVKYNAEAIGMASDGNFQNLVMDHLDELLGYRNDIGHGGSMIPPGFKSYSEMGAKTKTLITDYCNFCLVWIKKISYQII